ncbi:MAG: hypothetical protein GEU26_18260 [Nitrososphaeraceae archaeon]|nr:hypothetical protein [Nitrososphaeraceae archaeon]
MNINSKDLLYYGAAICTGIAGILHLTLVPNAIDSNINNAILFLVGGIAQIFWVLPMIKRWGRVWYAVGIAGTVILIALWVITRIADNPITGRGGPISERAIAVEVFQIAYVAITALIMANERIRKPSSIEEKR